MPQIPGKAGPSNTKKPAQPLSSAPRFSGVGAMRHARAGVRPKKAKAVQHGVHHTHLPPLSADASDSIRQVHAAMSSPSQESYQRHKDLGSTSYHELASSLKVHPGVIVSAALHSGGDFNTFKRNLEGNARFKGKGLLKEGEDNGKKLMSVWHSMGLGHSVSKSEVRSVLTLLKACAANANNILDYTSTGKPIYASGKGLQDFSDAELKEAAASHKQFASRLTDVMYGVNGVLPETTYKYLNDRFVNHHTKVSEKAYAIGASRIEVSKSEGTNMPGVGAIKTAVRWQKVGKPTTVSSVQSTQTKPTVFSEEFHGPGAGLKGHNVGRGKGKTATASTGPQSAASEAIAAAKAKVTPSEAATKDTLKLNTVGASRDEKRSALYVKKLLAGVPANKREEYKKQIKEWGQKYKAVTGKKFSASGQSVRPADTEVEKDPYVHPVKEASGDMTAEAQRFKFEAPHGTYTAVHVLHPDHERLPEDQKYDVHHELSGYYYTPRGSRQTVALSALDATEVQIHHDLMMSGDKAKAAAYHADPTHRGVSDIVAPNPHMPDSMRFKSFVVKAFTAEQKAAMSRRQKRASAERRGVAVPETKAKPSAEGPPLFIGSNLSSRFGKVSTAAKPAPTSTDTDFSWDDVDAATSHHNDMVAADESVKAHNELASADEAIDQHNFNALVDEAIKHHNETVKSGLEGDKSKHDDRYPLKKFEHLAHEHRMDTWHGPRGKSAKVSESPDFFVGRTPTGKIFTSQGTQLGGEHASSRMTHEDHRFIAEHYAGLQEQAKKAHMDSSFMATIGEGNDREVHAAADAVKHWGDLSKKHDLLASALKRTKEAGGRVVSGSDKKLLVGVHPNQVAGAEQRHVRNLQTIGFANTEARAMGKQLASADFDRSKGKAVDEAKYNETVQTIVNKPVVREPIVSEVSGHEPADHKTHGTSEPHAVPENPPKLEAPKAKPAGVTVRKKAQQTGPQLQAPVKTTPQNSAISDTVFRRKS